MIRKDGRPFNAPSEQQMTEKRVGDEKEKNDPKELMISFHRIQVPVNQHRDEEEPIQPKWPRRKPCHKPAVENAKVAEKREEK